MEPFISSASSAKDSYSEENEAVNNPVRSSGQSGDEVGAIFIATLEVNRINRLWNGRKHENDYSLCH